MSAPSPYPHTPHPSALPQNGIGTAGLVTGIIGLILSVTFVGYVVAIPLHILGVVFGAVGRSRARRGVATNVGAATAGLSMGIIGLVVLTLWLVIAATYLSGTVTR